MSCKEWTVLEKLLLSQAVYKYGEQSWLQVSSVLKQNALIQHRQSDFFDDKNCSLQYYGLIEKLEAEKDNPLPVVVQLARHLYIQRIQEIKNALVDGEQELGQLVSEIDLIRKGELDSQLLQMNAKEIEVCSTSIADKPKETIPLDSKLDNQRQKSWQKSVQILWQEIANHKSGPLFLNPIKKAKAPFYNKIVIKSTVEFERDIVLMLTNALMYNKEGTETYLLALEMLEDVKDQIELFKFANSFLKRKMV
ncbi:hypothetical protein RO3G_00871 [Rhizopus delemar RA 99-880]|uniref:Bromo domain-containing protein n=1 Tax=Rhizopus delemar (strain RA 99-880 / ATCC MYA-4621 / FGSC 9543 / NRRL 43880) TaxID=246409 RepID=I1BIY7_RHIO9|nr:hypothetical protein RO3G_00871 [Rhizopus delemar RA 99-880]|eukprot:EIE76167.1 hypothetical protein RO3G_00871 [Rhizopus delemar RA 99-880]